MDSQQDPLTGVVTANALRLRYFEWPGEEPVVLLLHGLGQNGLVWAPLGRALSPPARVLSLDLRGHGDSDKPGSGYLVEDLTEDVVAFMDVAGLRRVSLVGHAFGAKIAARVAGLYPERVLRLVLAEAGSPDPDPVTADWARLAYTLYHRPALGPFPNWEAAVAAARTLPAFAIWSPNQEAVLRHSLHARQPGQLVGKTLPQALIEGIEAEAAADLRWHASRISAVALVVMARGSASGVRWADRLQDARIAIVEGNHWLHTNNPGQFSATVREFLLAGPG